MRGFAALIVARELQREGRLDKRLQELAEGGMPDHLVKQARAVLEDIVLAGEAWHEWQRTLPEPTSQVESSQVLQRFPEYITTGEAADMLDGVTAEWVRQLVKRGRLVGHKAGRHWMVERTSVELLRASRSAA